MNRTLKILVDKIDVNGISESTSQDSHVSNP